MKGIELVKKIKELAKQEGVAFKIEHRRGKGSHRTLIYGDKFTIIPELKRELKTGTYKAILKQLDIHEKKLR